MQFQYNGDYPGLTAATVGQTLPLEAYSHDPIQFPPAQPIPCAKITTRVFHPNQNQVATVQNVLVRTVRQFHGGNDDASFSSNISSSSSSSDDSMKIEEPTPLGATITDGSGDVQNAYWIQRAIREAIYGRILLATVLKKRPQALVAVDGAEWEVTGDYCAVKEMSWQHIRRQRDTLAEDPIKEVSSMQYLKTFFQQSIRKAGQPTRSPESSTGVAESFQVMKERNIMLPLDLLSDERNLYSVMPFCDGGELFERLDLNERFSEEEARYWMDQILNVRKKNSK
jgi:hypothetical protein